MRVRLRLSLAALTFAAAASSAACHNPFCSTSDVFAAPASDAKNGGSSSGGNAAPVENAGASTSSVDATRIIAEADIVQLDQEQLRIYAMSKAGAVAIVDASTPGELTLLGRSSISGEPFEMYRRGDVLLTMSNHAVSGTGQVKDPLPPDEGFTIPPEDPTASAVIAAVDVSNPAQIKTTATFKVPGEIADSRIVGNVLYLASYENASCFGCSTDKRTVVTSFDVTNPQAPRMIDQVSFVGSDGFYKRSVIATTSRFYVGGVSAIAQTASDEGQIDVLDITDPSGRMTKGAKITVPGPITSRWQMDESAGFLRVVSERGLLTNTAGTAYPDIDTFRIESSSSLVRVGHASMSLPQQEALKTVRFDGTRAFAITFREKDPLFTIDLSDPANPKQAGQLAMPGWIFDLEPKGDRLIGLGLDRTDYSGNLNVSLIDVSSLSSPRLVDRVSFGPTTGYSDAMITQGILAEDQDRIQKAFRIFSDGLIAVPYSSGTQCTAGGAGVQLLSWTPSTLTKHATIPMSGNPRRAVRRDSDRMQELIGISDSNVSSFQIDNRDAASPTADVVIGRCVPRSVAPQNGGFNGNNVNDGVGVNDPVGGGSYDRSGSTCE